MKQILRRTLLCILAAMVGSCSVPLTSFASGAPAPETIEITYRFNPGVTEDTGYIPSDTVTWRDDCFTRSSYLGCSHLAELSAAAALSSTPYADPSLTPAQNEPLAPKYVTEFLTAAHFQDVETNKYYTTRQVEDSIGAAIGHKTIVADGRPYTLLAIVIRSANYTQEWAGNFTITGGSTSEEHFHAGFKAARDEAIRFAAKYMKEHGISGDLKVWIAGHSRGAATSNSIGGFFAGGGEEYFRAMNVPVSISPENVYCYTFSTPRTIRPGLTHTEDLSVAGNRAEYPNDTPGQAYVSTNTGAVDPEDTCYNGIRNYPKPHDVVPKMPPDIPGWDFTYYGKVCQYDSSDLPGGPVTEKEMLQQLGSFDRAMYNAYNNGGSPGDYALVTLDVDKLVEAVVLGEDIDLSKIMKKTDKGPVTMAEMMQGRINALEDIAASPRVFAQKDFQQAMQAVGGIHGLVGIDFSNPDLNIEDLTGAGIYWLLDYAVGRLREENTGEPEEDLVVRFLEKLLRYLLPGESIPEGSLCVIKIAELAARYFFPKTGDTKVSQKIVELVADQLPDPGWSPEALAIYAYLDTYLPKDADPDDFTKEQKVEALLRACAWGAEEGSHSEGETPEDACTELCEIIGIVGYIGFLDIPDWLDYALLSPDDPDKFPDQVLNILSSMMPEGETYADLASAADIWGKRAITTLFEDSVKALEGKGYSAGYIRDARRHYDGLKVWIRPLRNAIMPILLSTAGELLSIEDMVRNVSLLAQNGGLVAPSHYVQMDLAWAKARRAKGLWDHAHEPALTLMFLDSLPDATTGIPKPITIQPSVSRDVRIPDNFPEKSGRVFTGWNTARDGSGTNYAPGSVITLRNDTVLWAQWEIAGNSWYVIYDANGGTKAPMAQIIPRGQDAVLTTEKPESGSMAFMGWATDPETTAAEYQPGDTLKYDSGKSYVVLYALWQLNPPEKPWVLTFLDSLTDAASGIPAPMSIDPSISTEVRIPSQIPEKSGRVFTGWNTAQDGSGKDYRPGSRITLVGDTTLWAQWEIAGNSWYVIYDANGGTKAPMAQIIPRGQDAVLITEKPESGSMAFMGWATDPEATAAEYQPGDTLKYDSGKSYVVLYALWELDPAKRPVIISFNANGGLPDTVPEQISARQGEWTRLPGEQPAWDAQHDFLGWSDDPQATKPAWGSGSMVLFDQDTILYAIWDPHYKVIEGAGSVWFKGSGKTQRFVADGDLKYFTELRVDGWPFNEGVHISSGTTVADISAKAMETLSVGNHTVTFVYVDGEASAEFTVQKKQPPTGDTGHPALWLLMIIFGTAGLLLCILPYTRKKKKRKQGI